MALKLMTAEEAGAFVHTDDNVGFSGCWVFCLQSAVWPTASSLN